MLRKFPTLAAVAFVTLTWTGLASAQTIGGHITGSINDELGQPVPHVYVTAHGVEQSQVMKTEADGQFRLHDLVPGRYVLTIARDGFTTIVHSGIMVRGGKIAQLPMVLKVAPNFAAPISAAPDPFALMPTASRVATDLIAKNTR